MLFSPQILVRRRPARIAAAYAGGPGDIVPSATMWFGGRAYNSAYATGSNPAYDVVDTATGLITTTINIKTDGSLDNATILGLGYGVSVKKAYDQTGNGNHATQATLANMPTLTQNVIGSLPGMTFSKSASQFLSTPSLALLGAQPWSISAVAKRTGDIANSSILVSNFGLYFGSSSDTVMFYSGSLPTAAATENVMHAIQAVANGASSIINVDGSGATVDAGSSVSGSSTVWQIGANGSGGAELSGNILECGFWPVGFSAGNNTSLYNQQHAYWGV